MFNPPFGFFVSKKEAQASSKEPGTDLLGSDEELATALKNAYDASSTEELAIFFAHWHESIPPNKIKKIDDELVQDV